MLKEFTNKDGNWQKRVGKRDTCTSAHLKTLTKKAQLIPSSPQATMKCLISYSQFSQQKVCSEDKFEGQEGSGSDSHSRIGVACPRRRRSRKACSEASEWCWCWQSKEDKGVVVGGNNNIKQTRRYGQNCERYWWWGKAPRPWCSKSEVASKVV